VIVTGLGLLSIGTLLGGVWANESWGRYWGWDSKETWSLVTILVYAVVVHFRWIPSMNRPWVFAAGSFAAISSVIMTYFGVNYFLVGLHSYAGGDAAQVPSWVAIGALIMSGIIIISGFFEMTRKWKVSA
jgi:ABC-type transport system involved in cytochrome c biogenesis permease subunit